MEIQTDNPQEGYPFPCFSFDDKDCVALNTAYIMCSNGIDIRYILGVLNSKLGGFLAKLYVTQLQERQFRMLAQYVNKFPIPQPTNTQMTQIALLVQRELEEPSKTIELEIDGLVSNLFGLTQKEESFIEQFGL